MQHYRVIHMRKLFGTDGIRGKANRYPMTGDIAFRLGQATARKFTNKHQTKVIIGKDTRRSGYIFENALTAGLCSMGVDVYLVGPMPTPAIAHLVRSFAADAGIMITASHNPAGDNGIKFFDSTGYKLPDKIEMEIEKLVFSEELNADDIKIENVGRAYRIDDAAGRYIEFAKGSINSTSLAGLKIVLDCANGAAYKVAPLIFRELGADIIVYGNKPDGLNINKECGATHIELIQSAVLGNNADVGIAYDGDADRVIMVDELGQEFDGDKIMASIAIDLKKDGKLKQNTLVATRYSNIGLDEAMEKHGIKVVKVDNGDRYVMEKLVEIGGNFGGEFSGHIMDLDKITTGDGILTSLSMMKIIKDQKKKLSELGKLVTMYPQIIEGIDVKEKKSIEKLSTVQKAIDVIEAKGCTVFIRYSGTENKCRVMIQGTDEAELKKQCSQLVKAIKSETGA